MPQLAPFESITIGDVKITYLPDGGGRLRPTAVFPTITAQDWQPYAHLLSDDGELLLSVGVFLLEIGRRLILVDTGMGPDEATLEMGHFWGGRLLESLQQAGYSPDQITDVLFTHLHLDHIGWTAPKVNGKRPLTFNNAHYYIAATEMEFWSNTRKPNPATPHLQAMDGRITLLTPGDEPIPNIHVIATPGHTPGHIAFRLTAAESDIYLVGDVLFSPILLAEPTWQPIFDMNGNLAAQTRQHLLTSLIQPQALTIIGHMTGTVFGQIRLNEGQPQWNPRSS
ncbi:MAG: MBL fold metallo-hydrolase [Chloroflexi bacterium]|nr:MBL fold metallo-hydrolase [Chloroflexota bacterium]